MNNLNISLQLEVDDSPNFQVSSVLELIQRFTENFKIKQLNLEQRLEDLDYFRTLVSSFGV